MKCENCGNEHDGSYGSGRFCSKHCRCSYIAKQVKHHVCNFNVNRQHNLIWKCTICGSLFSTRNEMQIHRKEEHGFKKGMAWNKGLTSETSIKVKQIAEKNKISQKGRTFHHTKETREKLSEIRSKYLDSYKGGGFKDVGWYKVKNLDGIEYTVRGHWEENVANKLTVNGINWIRNRTLKYIKNGIRKTYIPDFYLPNTNEYIEVKGYYSDEDKEKMRLVLENNPGIKIYFIGEEQYKDFVNGKIVLNDSLLLK